ncbi:type II secretion system protein GspK [Geminicoccus roseus]|uniref:type II secretion system protein GspK n=1 Tax=Geminicoccus roseus TaxID=404900 RepID=UPI0012FBFE16|nr:type II secretion system protein GspK [Geminicoccus roseus]
MLVVIWMTGVLAVMALGFAGRVQDASQEVTAAEARLRASAMIDGELAQMLYLQLKSSEELGVAEDDDEEDGGSGFGDSPDEAEGLLAEDGLDQEDGLSSLSEGRQTLSSLTGDQDDGLAEAAGFGEGGAGGDMSGDLASGDGLAGDPAAVAPTGIEAVMRSGKLMTNTVTSDEVRLNLQAKPEMGRIDVNRGDPRVLRALLEKVADRAVATRAMEATEKGRELAGRAGAVIGAEPRAFVSVDAWLAATGMDLATAEKVRPYVTTHTGASAVNLAFAPQELIDVMPFLSRSQKERIAKAREESPDALDRVLAQIAADPSTETDGETDGETGGGEAGRPVMRVTVEAVVDGVLRRTDQFVVAFEPAGGASGSGAGLEGEQEPANAFGQDDEDAAASQAPLPFTILDRQTLDTAPPLPAAPESAAFAAGPAAPAAGAAP